MVPLSLRDDAIRKALVRYILIGIECCSQRQSTSLTHLFCGRGLRERWRRVRQKSPASCSIGLFKQVLRAKLLPRDEGMLAKEILCAFGFSRRRGAGWLGSCGGEDSPADISHRPHGSCSAIRNAAGRSPRVWTRSGRCWKPMTFLSNAPAVAQNMGRNLNVLADRANYTQDVADEADRSGDA